MKSFHTISNSKIADVHCKSDLNAAVFIFDSITIIIDQKVTLILN